MEPVKAPNRKKPMKSHRKMILDLPYEILEQILKVGIENLPDDISIDAVDHDITSDRVRFRLHSDVFKPVPQMMIYPNMGLDINTEYSEEKKTN